MRPPLHDRFKVCRRVAAPERPGPVLDRTSSVQTTLHVALVAVPKRFSRSQTAAEPTAASREIGVAFIDMAPLRFTAPRSQKEELMD